MDRHLENTHKLVEYFGKQSYVAKVHYLGTQKELYHNPFCCKYIIKHLNMLVIYK